MKPRAEWPPKDGKAKVKPPREIGSQFVRRKQNTDRFLGGEAQKRFDKAVASGQLKKGSAAYKKAEKAAKAELRANYNAAMASIGIKPKAKYSPKEQAENRKKAIAALNARGRGAMGRDGRSLFKDLAQGGNKYGNDLGGGMFGKGKKGYGKVIRVATRTDKGGGKLRKTNVRAFQTTQKQRNIIVDAKTGKQTIRTIKDGARAVKMWDVTKPIPPELRGAVRQYVAQKKGSWKGASAPALGEDGYIGFKGKPTAGKGKGGKTKSTANRTFQKKAEAKPKAKKAEAKPATKPAAGTAKPKKGETAKPKKEAAKTAPAKKDETPKVRRTAEADRLLAASKARKEAASKAKPASKPAPAAKPAAPAKKEAPAKRTTADRTLEPNVVSKGVKLVDSGVKNPPPRGNTSQDRKKVVEANLKNQQILADKVKKDGIASLSAGERSTFSFLTRTKSDFEKELKGTKWKK